MKAFQKAEGNIKISSERKKALEDFSREFGLHFRDLSLLDLAFHHRSFSNEYTSFSHLNNERLEFLGDSVLGLSVAAFLYSDMEDVSEGELSRIKSSVVSEAALAPIAKDVMHADKLLVLGKGEELSGGREKKAILADCFEAVMGAIYLDQGFEKAEEVILSLLVDEIRKVQNDKSGKNYKTILQEYWQKKHKACPQYQLEKETGPGHDMTFYVSVKLGNVTYGPEKGSTKKGAEQMAALQALRALGLED